MVQKAGQNRTYQRIDSAHHHAPPVETQANAMRSPALNVKLAALAAHQPCDVEAHPEWLSLHSDDLIERLQAWAADLDAREVQLNHRAAMQDQRERQFRMTQQGIAAELKEKQLAAEKRESELRRKARQLAFETNCR
ncbi:hypothetical protein Q31b_08110 [Novipirellula aureliae]|uniref:Uncharacterized protein n=2 Tax=Novipirellula aureliae TaxID=2527966 RepID=A0A5C6EAT3_9BACT|nr:hypothetical protein Q31b_08110 [Novipirellula aureliae]